MSTIYMIKNIKELLPEYVVLVKIGTFYEVYNNDSYIISYLFNYKIKTLIEGDKNCGFPTGALNKVLSILENKSINYIVVDKKHNYEEETKMNFKRKNKYNELLTKSKKYIDRITRINKIRNYLLNNYSKIESVEKIKNMKWESFIFFI